MIRPGEEGGGYLVHAVNERFEFDEFEDALAKAVEVTEAYAVQLVKKQNLETSYIKYECRNMYLDEEQIIYRDLPVAEDGTIEIGDDSDYGKYLETRIKVQVGGKIFANV